MKSGFRNEKELDQFLATPNEQVIQTLADLKGDLMILGVGGKMGPSLAKMAKNAFAAAGEEKRVLGASVFPSSDMKNDLQEHGIKIFEGDLLDKDFVYQLPDVENVIYMAGMKFGSVENLAMTWAVNSYLPTLISEKYRKSRIVAFSTGCVYPLVSVKSGGSREVDPVGPIGEYAQSCLGRERMFEYFSKRNQTPMTIIRLNYSVEMRYGVLVDVALKVLREQPVDVTMGFANVIWQGDANAMVLQSLKRCQSPPKILNVTGPETISLKRIAGQFAELLNVDLQTVGEEEETALLNDASQAFSLFGYPSVSLNEMIHWIADWLKNKQTLYDKPTHYETRNGQF
ncbi:NAD-dependent epimerase/dehydratase family protein [candidate division KSB1 bacterium]|nr:NAD-dependent epimerase/dehydratase family protein [candidate division KSB1 bacterium]